MKNHFGQPYVKSYFLAKSKKYVNMAKLACKQLSKENAAMYDENGETNEDYNDDTMCNFSDIENLLEFVDDKESFTSCGSIFVDLVQLDTKLGSYEKEIKRLQLLQAKAKKERHELLSKSLITNFGKIK